MTEWDSVQLIVTMGNDDEKYYCNVCNIYRVK